MTVVLCDSIQAKPLPIANAIIHVAVTRLVTAFWNREIFSIPFAVKANSVVLEIYPDDSGFFRVFQQKDAELSIAGNMEEFADLPWFCRSATPKRPEFPNLRMPDLVKGRVIGDQTCHRSPKSVINPMRFAAEAIFEDQMDEH